MTVCTSDFFVVLLCGESCSTFIVLRLHSTLACLGVHTLLQPVVCWLALALHCDSQLQYMSSSAQPGLVLFWAFLSFKLPLKVCFFYAVFEWLASFFACSQDWQ